MYYQVLLHDEGEIWKPDVLADVTTNVRNRTPERWSGIPANRSLGLILAGDDGYSHIRGMGRTVCPGTFGHNGAGGQLAWADGGVLVYLARLRIALRLQRLPAPRRASKSAWSEVLNQYQRRADLVPEHRRHRQGRGQLRAGDADQGDRGARQGHLDPGHARDAQQPRGLQQVPAGAGRAVERAVAA